MCPLTTDDIDLHSSLQHRLTGPHTPPHTPARIDASTVGVREQSERQRDKEVENKE